MCSVMRSLTTANRSGLQRDAVLQYAAGEGRHEGREHDVSCLISVW